MRMADVYLGLGSNLGDRLGHLQAAIHAIASLEGTRLVAQSPVYETPPMGPQDQGAYLNQAAHLRTELNADELLKALQSIELQIGRAERSKRQHWGPREIDIDVLLFGAKVIDEPAMQVPHPGMTERWFVLKPLADLAGEFTHPTWDKSLSQLLEALEKRSPELVGEIAEAKHE